MASASRPSQPPSEQRHGMFRKPSITPSQPRAAVCQYYAHQSEPPPPDYSDAYTILAGVDHVPIVVHKDTLCRGAEYFAAACSEAWQNGDKEKTVTVEAVHPSTMRTYIHWKYTRKFDLCINNLSRTFDPTDEADIPSHVMRALLWLYVACDVFLDEEVKNAVMDQIIQRTDRLINRCIFADADHIHYVWDNTGPDSKLRKYVLEACAAKASPADLADMTRYPLEFFHELAVLHTRIRDRVPCGLPGLRAAMARPCEYHDHVREDASLLHTRTEQGGDEEVHGRAKRPRLMIDQDESDEFLYRVEDLTRQRPRVSVGARRLINTRT
ncbi:Ankyrin repeat and BTB/POZ domain-containing protein 1 [Elasticomyces elasticus]|uniref:Ankyrin repeat and BTB/POZ domain-containing protein 1 n=1 Tax=Elasticomyces elasticus TaxID=574655 RepID=A0AAN7W2T6_9PEZI|nr:Ankyrin repeat and BTB/POZ domain-containing protein 1 [Elasticomyces elasticus]